jgi:hypothetical protein
MEGGEGEEDCVQHQGKELIKKRRSARKLKVKFRSANYRSEFITYK